MYDKKMKITMCGSMIHINAMKNAANLLTDLGYEVHTPSPREGEVKYDTLSEGERASFKEELIQEHLDHINESDAVFIFNEDKKETAGYIGGSTLMEMAFAYAQKIEIFLLKPAPNLSYRDEILGMKPIIIDNDIPKIHSYFTGLPKTYVSSKSPIKLSAVSRGMRRAGIRTQIVTQPTESNVSEQPMSTEETYNGAMNRHEALMRNTSSDTADYYVTVESGQHVMHSDHNTFGGSVTIIEKKDGERKIGINISVEYPRYMTDKVPSQYPDLGVLVQKEYGSSLKDPLPFFTNNKLTRRKTIEEAIFNVAVQLSQD
jgi:non-canonical (house-cleaning) NTP pyrophosphatase